MSYELPWGTLPKNLRVGSSFSEPMRLYRGEKTEKVARGAGLLSLAVEQGRMDVVYQFGDACESGSDVAVRALLNVHIGYAHRNGTITPFVSASPYRGIAEIFAQRPDELVVEFEVPACRTIAGPFTTAEWSLPNEVLVIGGVSADEIIALHDTKTATE